MSWSPERGGEGDALRKAAQGMLVAQLLHVSYQQRVLTITSVAKIR